MGTAVNLISACQYNGKSDIVTKRRYQYFYFSFISFSFTFLFGMSNHIGIGDNGLWIKQKAQNHTG
jgi:hypothetical protein